MSGSVIILLYYNISGRHLTRNGTTPGAREGVPGGGDHPSTKGAPYPQKFFCDFLFLLLNQREHFVVDYQRVSTIYGSNIALKNRITI